MHIRSVILALLILHLAGSAGGQQISEIHTTLDELLGRGDFAAECAQPEDSLAEIGTNATGTTAALSGLRAATDGTYEGSTSQDREIRLVVLGGQIKQWVVNYACPGFTWWATWNVNCPIISDLFTCGYLPPSCTYEFSWLELSGSVDSATQLSGTITIRHQYFTSSCCQINNMSWSASLPPPPDAPTDLMAASSPAKKVDLAWTDNASDETEYRVMRKLESEGSFTQIATLTADATSHTDDTVEKGMRYVYRVLACNGVGCSDPSNEVTVSVPALSFFIWD